MQILRYKTVKELTVALEQFPMVNVGMPTELWLVLAENRQKLLPTSKIFDEVNNGLITRFKPKDREGLRINADDPNWLEFEAEQKKLLNKTIEIDIKTFPREKLKEVETMGGVPGIYSLFDYIITDNPIKDEVESEEKKEGANPSNNGEVGEKAVTKKENG